MRGGTLRQLIRARALPAPVVARLFVDLIDGLGYAHSRGLVHRDIKPANLLLNEHGVLAVADFGIAKAVDDTALTASGGLVGTPAYMSPEQVQGEPLTPASDLFAAGIVLYEMLVGTNPFAQPTNAATLLRVVAVDVPPLYDVLPSVPRALERVVSGLLVATPGKRFTATMVRELLLPLLVDEAAARRAVTDAAAAREIDAQSAAALATRATALDQAGAHARAAFLLWQGTQRHPDDAALAASLAVLKERHRFVCDLTPTEGIRRAVAEVAAAPRSAQVVTRAAARAWAERDLVRSVAFYTRLVSLRPDDGNARVRLAEIVDDEADAVSPDATARVSPATGASEGTAMGLSEEPSSPARPSRRPVPAPRADPPSLWSPVVALWEETPLAIVVVVAGALVALLVGNAPLRVVALLVLAGVWLARGRVRVAEASDDVASGLAPAAAQAAPLVRSAGSPRRALSAQARALALRGAPHFAQQERFRALLERASSSLVLDEPSSAVADLDAAIDLIGPDDERYRDVVSLRTRLMGAQR
jgi:hypothetical protein